MATTPSSKKKKKTKQNRRSTLIVVVMALALLAMILPSIVPSRSPASTKRTVPENPNYPTQPAIPEPIFQKEGVLSFVDGETSQVSKSIDIEIAQTEKEREQGLMYRHSMSDSQGMLFIFDRAGQLSFWMKNTFLSLDILFVDENLTILNIYENTRPRSESPLPSSGPANYVVEVVGGFTRAYGIKPGGKIRWE